MRSERVFLIGEITHPEFREAWGWLVERCPGIRAVPIERSARTIRSSGSPPELIVVAVARPGEVSPHVIESLHQAAPLARIVTLLGSWCEGEPCSGRPCPGVVRLYWHEFASRMGQEYVGDERWTRLWSSPRTATAAERLAHECRPIARTRQGLVAIGAASRMVYEGLADMCAQAGYATAWISATRVRQVEGLVGGIWDDSSAVAGRPLPLSAFARQVRPAAVLALLHFPRRSDCDRAYAAGASAVHAKPFEVDDVLADLVRLASPTDAEPPRGHAA
jgi:hypothetical protein